MKTLAIRAEDKNMWEKRAPLVPEHVQELLADGTYRILVQSPSIRVFPDNEYAAAGAELGQDISSADLVLGIKEIPPEQILANKVYLFFSHTIKGQKENMPLLHRILETKSTLIDYEKIVDTAGRRLLFFGKFAGDAGAIDILWLVGQELKRRKLDTPLSELKQSLAYPSLAHAQNDLKRIALLLKTEGWPELLTPCVVGIFGYGNVSQGAQEIFDLFQVERIKPSELLPFITAKKYNSRTLYLVVFQEEDMVRHRAGQAFQLQDYYHNPHHYEPTTAAYLPHLKILVNAVYWDKQYPKFVSRGMARKLWDIIPQSRFYAIADLSCDIAGAVEITVKTTNPGQPAFKYNPETDIASDDLHSEGILILAVDNLPGELPYDASLFFSTQLKQFIPALMAVDFSKSLPDTGLPAELQGAVIAHKGALTTPYTYLQQYL